MEFRAPHLDLLLQLSWESGSRVCNPGPALDITVRHRRRRPKQGLPLRKDRVPYKLKAAHARQLGGKISNREGYRCHAGQPDSIGAKPPSKEKSLVSRRGFRERGDWNGGRFFVDIGLSGQRGRGHFRTVVPQSTTCGNSRRFMSNTALGDDQTEMAIFCSCPHGS